MQGLTPVQRVAAYALLRDGDRVLVVRAAPTLPVGGMWFLPGGGVEHGEHPVDALVREVAEETGLVAEVHELLAVRSSVAEFPVRDALVHTVALFYDAAVTGGVLRHEVGGSSVEAAWLTVAEALTRPLAPFVAELLQETAATE